MGSIELDQQVVNLLLGGDGELGVNEGLGDDLVDVVNGLLDTWISISETGPDGKLSPTLADVVGSAISELDSLVSTSGGTGRNLSSEQA